MAPSPPCDSVAAHVGTLVGSDDYGKAVTEVFKRRCVEDIWADEAKNCILETTSVEAPKTCSAKLTQNQQILLGQQLDTIDREKVPPACGKYEALLVEVGHCEKLPQAMRDDLKAKFQTSKALWEAMPDKRELGPMCGNAIVAVKSVADGCPGIDKF